MRTEANLRGRTVASVRQQADGSLEVMRHEDAFAKGVPDMSLTGPATRTTWWEFKHGDPFTEISKLQSFRLARLKGLYAVYGEGAPAFDGKRFACVVPGDVVYRIARAMDGSRLSVDALFRHSVQAWEGWPHVAVAKWIIDRHKETVA